LGYLISLVLLFGVSHLSFCFWWVSSLSLSLSFVGIIRANTITIGNINAISFQHTKGRKHTDLSLPLSTNKQQSHQARFIHRNFEEPQKAFVVSQEILHQGMKIYPVLFFPLVEKSKNIHSYHHARSSHHNFGSSKAQSVVVSRDLHHG